MGRRRQGSSPRVARSGGRGHSQDSVKSSFHSQEVDSSHQNTITNEDIYDNNPNQESRDMQQVSPSEVPKDKDPHKDRVRRVQFQDSAEFDVGNGNFQTQTKNLGKPSVKRLTRSKGSRISKEALDEMLNENADKEIKESTLQTLLIKVFAFFFPTAIKSFVPTYVQCVGGLLVFCLIVAVFIYLYVLFGECDTQVIETSEIPDNALYCKERYLAQQMVLGLDNQGVWSTELDYDKLSGGPWQLNFQGFQANEETFDSTVALIFNKSEEFIINSKGKPFFEILEEAFFYKPSLSGVNGAVYLQANIELPTIFNNYVVKEFSTINLRQELQENWEKNRIARYNSNWAKLYGAQPCERFVGDRAQYNFENHLICRSNADYNSDKSSEHWIEGTQVRTLAFSFYPLLMEHLFPGSNFSLSYRDDQDPIPIRWDFAVLFGYDYCNQGGSKDCEKLLYESNSLAPQGYDAFKGDPYVGVGDFIEMMNQQKTLVPKDNYDKQLTQNTIYINSLKQFGFFLGKDFIFRPEGYDNSDEQQNSRLKNGKPVEYIIVPQISLATPSLLQTQILGETYFVCESCEDRARFLQLARNGEERIAGLCKKSAYLLLHLYAYTFDFNFTDSGIQSLHQDVTIEDHYVTTFLYRLDRAGEDQSYFTQNFRERDFVYHYNSLLSELDELHCDASEWRYEDNVNVTVPFTLTTGIQTCEVEYCDSILERLGDAQANVQLFYLLLLIALVSVFVCTILPKVRSKDKEKRKEFANMLFESLTSVADNV